MTQARSLSDALSDPTACCLGPGGRVRPFRLSEAAVGPQRRGTGAAAEFVRVEAPGHSREPAGGAQSGRLGVGGETPGGADFP